MEAVATKQNSGDTASIVTTTGLMQYLTFSLGQEDYGVDILRVQEIRGWHQVTRVPNAPAHMLGVLNLRGTIVPIIDMRMRFHLEKVEYNPVTVIIVLSIQTPKGTRVFGIVVDSVSDVLDVTSKDIKATPDFGTTVNTDFISGLATVSERMVMLLDIDKLLSADELAQVNAAAAA
ncbi:MAG: chemotaxis protein CheW [Gammaproteobacteria bacterium]|nr:chemotaxis protein CheW [Gammaproteobacteria bacterium]